MHVPSNPIVQGGCVVAGDGEVVGAGAGAGAGARAGTAAGAEPATDAGAGAEAVDADDADGNRSSRHRCSRQARARERSRRQARRRAWPPDRRACPVTDATGDSVSLQVPAARRSVDPPHARRHPPWGEREPLARSGDRYRRRSRRVRERTRPATPTTRARTVKRTSPDFATPASEELPVAPEVRSPDPQNESIIRTSRSGYLRATISRTTRRTSRRPHIQRRLVGYSETRRWDDPTARDAADEAEPGSLRGGVAITPPPDRLGRDIPLGGSISPRLEVVDASLPCGRRIVSRSHPRRPPRRLLSRDERVAFPDGGLLVSPTTRESVMQIKSWVRRGAAAVVLVVVVGVLGGCRYGRFGPGVLGPARGVREQRELGDQFRERLFRRAPIRAGDVGGLRRWGVRAGAPMPAELAVQQIIVAERVLAKQGWNAWPECSRSSVSGRRRPDAARGGSGISPGVRPTSSRLETARVPLLSPPHSRRDRRDRRRHPDGGGGAGAGEKLTSCSGTRTPPVRIIATQQAGPGRVPPIRSQLPSPGRSPAAGAGVSRRELQRGRKGKYDRVARRQPGPGQPAAIRRPQQIPLRS